FSVRCTIAASVYGLNFRFRSQWHGMTVDILILGEKNTVDFFSREKQTSEWKSGPTPLICPSLSSPHTI
ncbi:MAG: hypothetical protein ACK56F_00860, partial [bacterium]